MKLLKPVLSGTVLSALAASPVFAQAPLFNWTGFYAGMNLGGAWGKSSFSDAVGNYFANGNSHDPSGVIGGLQAGYNWQSGNGVFGLEADIDLSSARETTVIPLGPTITHTSRLNALATLRARAGITVDRTLVYVTAGGAHGWIKNTLSDPGAPFVVGPDSAWGWVAGAGVEHAFGNNWSARAEFLHTRLGSETITGVSGFGYGFKFKDSVSVARAGINYRF